MINPQELRAELSAKMNAVSDCIREAEIDLAGLPPAETENLTWNGMRVVHRGRPLIECKFEVRLRLLPELERLVSESVASAMDEIDMIDDALRPGPT